MGYVQIFPGWQAEWLQLHSLLLHTLHIRLHTTRARRWRAVNKKKKMKKKKKNWVGGGVVG
jgi:hypothetical protein